MPPNRVFKNSGKVHQELKRRKLNLMHIAICRLLEPYGFYEFDFLMKKVGPTTKLKKITTLKAGNNRFDERSHRKLFYRKKT
jgi:hypothetical protein